ncbi:MAG: hypothetical protein P4L75_02715 [Clostridia bacterium]|nr:hypothetical protein [Clostridia bacterium]MDR3645598.1 hypothetical protein [Clostridia bacterium]
MVKGMTRRIIEIKQTGNTYFEKAVFYCRTNVPHGTTEDTLTQEAARIIDRLCREGISTSAGRCGAQSRKKRLLLALRMLASAAAGAMVTIGIMQLLQRL